MTINISFGHTNYPKNMHKLLRVSMVVLSLVLLLIAGVVGYRQFVHPATVKAAGQTTYSETWTATDSIYSAFTSGTRTCSPGTDGCSAYSLFSGYHSGIPSEWTTCAMGTSYGGVSCQVTVTKWSVTGTVNTP